MKREGRQHGTVRTHNTIFLPNPVVAGRLSDSTTVAGFQTRVASNPANNSKHTGKCRRVRCAGGHCHQVSKSRDKAKGARKLRSHDVSLNHRLLSWRVVDSGGEGWCPGGAGTSATGILGYLSDYRWDEGDGGDVVNEEDEEGGGVLRDPFPVSYDLDVGCGDVEQGGEVQEIHEEKEEEEEEEEMEGGGIEVDDEVGDDDDDMSFCEIGFVWEYVDEEDWCVVGEM